MANALHGTVTIDGTNLAYTAPTDLDTDTVYISYYEGWQLRGFTEYRMINEALVMSGDADGDGKVNISDVTTLIDYLLSGNTSVINLVGADCNQDSRVNISDVTALIDYLLSGSWN